jgi:hypothetical protein
LVNPAGFSRSIEKGNPRAHAAYDFREQIGRRARRQPQLFVEPAGQDFVISGERHGIISRNNRRSRSSRKVALWRIKEARRADL